jgi:hypothetical protein
VIEWWRLDRELGRWQAAGHRVRLWWRDDDGTTVTPALIRLVRLAERFQMPLLLAIVPGRPPSNGLKGLSVFLEGRPGLFVGQHGVTHANRRRPGETDAEFPAGEAPAAIAAAIGGAWPRIAALPGSLPVFAPPWNAAHPALEEALRNVGLRLSAGAENRSGAAQVHVDLMRWKPAPCFRGKRRCLSHLRRVLRQRRLTNDWVSPVGLLTHHLVHDEATWAFLAALAHRTHTDPRITWVPPPDLFADTGRPGWLGRGPAAP